MPPCWRQPASVVTMQLVARQQAPVGVGSQPGSTVTLNLQITVSDPLTAVQTTGVTPIGKLPLGGVQVTV